MTPDDVFEQNPDYLPPKPDEPALHRAAREGDRDTIIRMAREGCDINLPFDIRLDPGAREKWATPLMVAAGSGYGAGRETLDLLLSLGADPLINLGSGSAARFAAAGLGWNYLPGGDAERLRLCLDLGCDPDETDERGVTLLADAAATGDTGRVQLLLERAANPDASNTVVQNCWPELLHSPFNETAPYSFRIPLHNAVEADNLEMVRLLVAAGANVNMTDHGGQTALYLARSTAVARFLVGLGLDLETSDCLGWSPLVAAVNEGSLRQVRALLEAGADPNATHDRGFTVFMSAVGSERRLEVLQALVDAGANPHAVSDLGWNAFHAAIDVNGEANEEASVRSTFGFLKQLGVDINHRDNHGESPLRRARERGTRTEIRALLDLGATD